MPTKLSKRADLQPRVAGKSRRRTARKRKKMTFGRFVKRLLLTGLLVCLLFTVWLFWTPWGGTFRYVMADTLISTQHRYLAKYIIGQAALDKRVAEYNKEFEQMGAELDTHVITRPTAVAQSEQTESKPLVEIETISTVKYHGYVMTVNDPTKIRLGVPDKVGRGEKVSSMVKRLGAIAGVNAGGFADPQWMGNGFQPIGVVISQGKMYYNGLGGKKSTQIVGLDGTGKMVAGNYTLDEMEKLGVQEAVSFSPRIIVNGKGLIKNAKDGWGIAPRTAMGQRDDGAIIFVVIDGRQPGYSIGADLYDVQNIMLAHGAVIAANLDGGSSTVLVKDNEVLNRPANKQKERYLPTAFLVFDHPEDVSIPNIWEGIRPQDIDPGKW